MLGELWKIWDPESEDADEEFMTRVVIIGTVRGVVWYKKPSGKVESMMADKFYEGSKYLDTYSDDDLALVLTQ